MYYDAAKASGNTRLAQMISGKGEEEDEVDNAGKFQYNRVQRNHKTKRTAYSQYNTLVMQWAFSSKTKIGDIKLLYNPSDNTWNKLIADDSEDKYGILESIKDIPSNADKLQNLFKEVYHDNNRREHRAGESIRNDYERYWSLSNSRRDDYVSAEEQKTDGRTRKVHGGESTSNGIGNSGQSIRTKEHLSFSLPEVIQDENGNLDIKYAQDTVENAIATERDKIGKNVIPNLKGLKDAITKKTE